MKNEIVKNRRFAGQSFDELMLLPPGQFIFCAFSDCTFRKASLRTNLDGQFLRCLFEQSDLREAKLCGRFEECIFRDSDLSGARASQLEFSACTFVRVRFKKVAFHWITFRKCHFEACEFFKGELGSSRFIECSGERNSAKKVFTEKTEWLIHAGFGIEA